MPDFGSAAKTGYLLSGASRRVAGKTARNNLEIHIRPGVEPKINRADVWGWC